jgi:arylsulfatase A-like enzyme/Tfp pilus assembly protein PilF
MPSHSSIFTGRFPPVHGVRDNGGFSLDPSERTLAEVLRDRGAATGGFIGAYVLDSKWGINQGFERYFDEFDLSKYRAISLGAIQRPANEVADQALAWLETTASKRFFAWVHFYDAHTPYEPPSPFNARFAGRPYQGEVAFADSQLGRIVSFLEERGLLDKTIVVVVGDHGESLGDHGESAHGFFVYDSVMRVPLVIRAPYAGMRGRRINDPVRTVDIMPTVLDLVGLRERTPMDGVSLVPLLTGARREMGLEAYGEALYPLHHFGWSDLRALREGRFKLIAAPRPELYDMDADPGETRNVFGERRALGDRMLQRLAEMEAEWKKAGGSRQREAVEVDPDAKARLAALGYVGSFVKTAIADVERAKLPDPKDKVHLFNKISHARDISKDEGSFDEVVGILREILAEDPNVMDAWFMLGNVHASRGKPEEAIGFFKRVLELKPDDEMAVVNLANAYRTLGRDEEALVGYRHFLTLDPKNAQVRYQIAQILIDHGKYDEAATELEQALTAEPKLAAAKNALGVIAIRRGDLQRAEREIAAALEQKPNVRLAHFNLALIAEERGDWARAVQEYEKEIADHPNASYKAAFNLGKLYGQLGDRARQEQAYRRALEINPRFAEGYFYLAKLFLDRGERFGEAVSLARKGLEVGAQSAYAPLGHYVIADIYNRLGRRAEAEREAELGRRLEARRRAGQAGSEN